MKLCCDDRRAIGADASQGVLKFHAPDLVELVGAMEHGTLVKQEGGDVYADVMGTCFSFMCLFVRI